MANYVQEQFADTAFEDMPQSVQDFVRRMYVYCAAKKQTIDLHPEVQRTFGGDYAAGWAAFNKGFAGLSSVFNGSEIVAPRDQLVFRYLLAYAEAEDLYLQQTKGYQYPNIFDTAKAIHDQLDIDGMVRMGRDYVYYYDEYAIFPDNKFVVFNGPSDEVTVYEERGKNERNYQSLVNKLGGVFDSMIEFATITDDEYMTDAAIDYIEKNCLSERAIAKIRCCNSQEELVACLRELYGADNKTPAKKTSKKSVPVSRYYQPENQYEDVYWDENNLQRKIDAINEKLMKRNLSQKERDDLMMELGHLECDLGILLHDKYEDEPEND